MKKAEIKNVKPLLQQHNVIGSLLGLKNQEIAFRVFFFDGSDYSTGQMLSFNEAMAWVLLVGGKLHIRTVA